MTHLFYIHGFLSGPNAVKATMLKEYLKEYDLGASFDMHNPDYPDPPEEAYNYLCGYFDRVFEEYKSDEVCLIGSSMGGFFSTLMAQRHGCKAVLLNPCVHPQNYFKALIGPQFNSSTNRNFELKSEMIDVLKSLDASVKVDPKKTYVIIGDQDEVLDYSFALELYKDCQIDIIKGEDHAFTHDFASLIKPILDYAAS